MKSYYRGRTPVAQLFRELDGELERAEKLVFRFGWLRQNAGRIWKALDDHGDPLAKELNLALEGHPSVPFGLNGMDVEGMSLCRIVDRFQTVLAEFVGAIFKAEPKTLLAAGVKEVRAEDVLSCDSLDDFRERFAADRLRALGRFGDVRKFLIRLKVHIKLDQKTERTVTEAIALRNLLVHARGRVDKDFLDMTGRTDVKIGDIVSVDVDTFKRSVAALRTTGDAFQKAVGGKFFGSGASELGSRPDVFRETKIADSAAKGTAEK